MKILIADDELPLLSFLQRGLESEGYDVISESDVHNLIVTISSELPVVAVLDRMFGDVDSLVLIQSIKRLPSPPMVLLLTAMDDVSDRVDGLRQGADVVPLHLHVAPQLEPREEARCRSRAARGRAPFAGARAQRAGGRART